jgi:hypothetical protein
MGHLKKLNQKTKNEPLLDMHPTEITLGKRKKEHKVHRFVVSKRT